MQSQAMQISVYALEFEIIELQALWNTKALMIRLGRRKPSTWAPTLGARLEGN